MLNRLTVTALLTCVVAIMATCVVAFLGISAWDSLGRLQTANRISLIAEVSGNAFTAMHNLRQDRSNTGRGMNGDLPIYPQSGYVVAVLANIDPPAAQSMRSVFSWQ